MKQLFKLNRSYIIKQTATWVARLYALLGFIAVFVPFDKLIPESVTLVHKVLYSLLILLGVTIITFAFVSAYVAFRKRVSVLSANNGHHVYLQYGDLFSPQEVNDPNRRRNIVIPVNRCFDTIVDNKLISEATLQGITINRLVSREMYTLDSLDNTIDSLLAGQEYETLSTAEKPAGKLRRYPVGTVIDLPGEDNVHYLLWALSTFDSKLKAQTTMVEFATAVQKLVEACNMDSEGFPVLLPLVGAGLSRTNKSQCDILRYLVSTFHINKMNVNCDVHVIIRNDIKNDVAITDFR